MFQVLINDILCNLLNHFVFVYLDDILIFSRTLDRSFEQVRLVLQRLPENKLYKPEKCEFHLAEVSFLIAQRRLHPDFAKIQAAEEWPTLSTHN